MEPEKWIHRFKYFNVFENPGEAFNRDPGKPDEKHKPAKQSTNLACAAPLRFEHHEQAAERDDDRRKFSEWFKCTKHTDGWSDNSIGGQ